MKFNTQLKTLFLDPHSEIEHTDEKVNIILSPALYWVKRQTLPVKYIRDVMKLLPSIFEESVPEGHYSYSAYRDGDAFVLFAYDDKYIIDTLHAKGISMNNVANVYFAQSELQDIQKSVKINESQSLYNRDGVIIIVPCCWIEESGALDLSTLHHTKHSIRLAQFGHIVDRKSFYKIGSILGAFIALLSLELFITTQKTQHITTQTEQLFSKYKLKPTMFQNRSILKKYQTIHKNQKDLRAYISSLLTLRLKKENRLTNITYKDHRVVALFSGIAQGEEHYILRQLRAKKVKFKSSFKSKNFRVEIRV